VRSLTKENLEDIMTGCAFMGSGGGGNPEGSLKRIYDDLNAGLVFGLMPVEELGADDYAASPFGVASTAPKTPEEQARYAKLPRIQGTAGEAAMRLLERKINKKLKASLAGEIGSANVANALSVGARMGIPTLDADLIGRSAPQINQMTLVSAGISILPAALATQFGDEMVLEKVLDPSRIEEVIRVISTVSLAVSVAAASISGSVARTPDALVVGSISHAEIIGKAFRAAVQSKEDPIAAVTAAGKGFRIFEGTISDFSWKDQAGHLLGDVKIMGTGPYRDSAFRIWYMNESIMAWKNDQPAITPPDLIITIRRNTGEALPNPHYEKGDQVVVISFPAPAPLRTPAGLASFGPKHFGFDLPYIPIEQRMTP
jgi:uncharacterized protein